MLNGVCYVCISTAASSACVSRSVHISPHGTWAVITFRKTLGYVDITCVMFVSKSHLPFIVSYDFFWTEDRKQHLDYMRFVACI